MTEDFGDSTGSGLVNTAKQAAKEVVQTVVTKGAGIGGKGGGGISLSGEAKDMIDKLVCTTCGATKDAPQATSDAAK